MRFTFLGTGTSSGIPAIGCDCATCTSPDPRDQRLRCAASVQFVDHQGRPRGILLDAGPDLRQQVLRFGVRRSDAILFTHNHVDHVFGLDETRRFNALQRGPIGVYADDRTIRSPGPRQPVRDVERQGAAAEVGQGAPGCCASLE